MIEVGQEFIILNCRKTYKILEIQGDTIIMVCPGEKGRTRITMTRFHVIQLIQNEVFTPFNSTIKVLYGV